MEQLSMMNDENKAYKGMPEEEKEKYRQILREKLPELKKIEGFPIGEDEDILALSDPPYYTACPNPFIEEFIKKWQWEKHLEHGPAGSQPHINTVEHGPAGSQPHINTVEPASSRLNTSQLLKDINGEIITEETFDPSKCPLCIEKDEHYHREPYAADVSEGKNHPIYNAHSYHTKVPHKAIMRYILHYTEPGDIVFDGFCGTGMTGVAAQLCGDRKAVEELGYKVDDNGIVYDKEEDNGHVKWKPFSKLGARKAVLNDLSPAATFIAYNYNTPVDVEEFEREAKRILKEVEDECGWMYETYHIDSSSCKMLNKVFDFKTNVEPASSRLNTKSSSSTGLAGSQPHINNEKGISDYEKRQGNLPHIQIPCSYYFITFKTHNKRCLSEQARDIILNSFKYFDGKRYNLLSLVVMPDHVHSVLYPLEKSPGIFWDLSDLMHSIKSYSANEINKIEGKIGEKVFQTETYDHVIRDEKDAHRIFSYICNNPVKKGLAEQREYKWYYVCEELGRAGWKPASLGKINYTVWSDVFVCPECAGEIVFWDVAVDKEKGEVRDKFNCCHCGTEATKRTVERAWETKFDKYINETVKQAKQVPVLVNYSVGKKRFEKEPDGFDMELLKKIEEMDIPYWFPRNELPMGYNTEQPKRSHGTTHVHHFYTKRNFFILAKIKTSIINLNKPILFFMLTSMLNRATQMNRLHLKYYVFGGGGCNAGYLKGTLYISSIPIETSVVEQIKDRIKWISRSFQKFVTTKSNYITSTISLQNLSNKKNNSIDYIFTDPPFGSNIMYSELNFLWEAWLKVISNNKEEAIISNTQKKGILEYQKLMESCFKKYYRVLKPGRWMTVEFSNTSSGVWNAIQEALQRGGFVVANVAILDKKQGSFKAVTTTTAVKQDLIISAYKPPEIFIKLVEGASSPFSSSPFPEKAGEEKEKAGSLFYSIETLPWDFIRMHLSMLPIFTGTKGQGQAIAERTPRILFDRMVAYFVQKNYPVPLSSGEFQQKILEKFPERDGMIFLPEQVPEYERNKMSVKEFLQLTLFVEDEKGSIEWLRQKLQKKPQTYQDIQPDYMKELQHIQKYEKMPELGEILEQNFLQYSTSDYERKEPVPKQIISYLKQNYHEYRSMSDDDQEIMKSAKGRWYVPDPNKSVDLEKIREKSLLKEFRLYMEEIKTSKKKLKHFRLEAIRCGFKNAWQEKDYGTIVDMGEKLPGNIIQEDETLLMYYDNALMMVEG